MLFPCLYIAGPMTGYSDFNDPAFFDAAQVLQGAGYATINPADIGIQVFGKVKL